jgi:hypothetical protein
VEFSFWVLFLTSCLLRVSSGEIPASVREYLQVRQSDDRKVHPVHCIVSGSGLIVHSE